MKVERGLDERTSRWPARRHIYPRPGQFGIHAEYSDRESNPDQRFRKPPFYPLNYQSEYYMSAFRQTVLALSLSEHRVDTYT